VSLPTVTQLCGCVAVAVCVGQFLKSHSALLPGGTLLLPTGPLPGGDTAYLAYSCRRVMDAWTRAQGATQHNILFDRIG